MSIAGFNLKQLASEGLSPIGFLLYVLMQSGIFLLFLCFFGFAVHLFLSQMFCDALIKTKTCRPWRNGLVKNDPQRRLAMDNPYLHNGDPIPGFKGYAVNMIDMASEELNITTNSGHGLRETLFYGVFGELQVYETGVHLEAALPYINGGDAVSLDGVISKENGFIYSGCWYLRFSLHP